MRCDKRHLLLYAVTDRSWLKEGQTLAMQVEASLQGGVTMVQLREKHLERGRMLALALELKALCHQHGVPLIINDDVQLALEVGADGVHVGQHDMEAGSVRALLGPDRMLGVSVQTVEQALLAHSRGAGYLGVGAVFPTGTKQDACEVSMDTVRAICAAVELPVVAIGGIGPDNLGRLAGSGVSGVAVVSALYACPDAAAAARVLRAGVEQLVDR